MHWEYDGEGRARRLVVCAGLRCRWKGSRALARRAKASAAVVESQCLGLCPKAPVVVLYPRGLWLGCMTREALDLLMEGTVDPRLRAKLLGDLRNGYEG
ncbi:(2Fe-2S) ferredoxin domain-containing protein [Sulfobacillus harzensis]|uniref:(2Fe-2S) ferredoxin domain-containing protein n=1 Tax=Sulfobacillus harzensis TaxID=2729629 RepID=A0A7Y0L1S6_9FIRM|nr:(2Fe-2S) ferredoxin domain-containing protein [Sulfobacillus harzensis]NMP21640.1 (2Fe-2S) ferredoxin domain-containing protein [Sulfobacillus harzensis]